MFGALFHDEYPEDGISTQFSALGSLLKCPGWVGKGPQSLKVKICILIYQIFVLEANTTFVCLKAPSPQNNKAGSVSLPGSVSLLNSFQKTESQRDKSETSNQKGPEWFLLHLITTSSLSLDRSAILDSIAGRNDEDSLELGSCTPLLLKSMEEECLKVPFHCWMLLLPLPQVAQSW